MKRDDDPVCFKPPPFIISMAEVVDFFSSSRSFSRSLSSSSFVGCFPYLRKVKAIISYPSLWKSGMMVYSFMHPYLQFLDLPAYCGLRTSDGLCQLSIASSTFFTSSEISFRSTSFMAIHFFLLLSCLSNIPLAI